MGICSSVATDPLQVPEPSKTMTIRNPEDVLEPRESLRSIDDTLTRVESQILTTEACMTAFVVLAVGVTYFNVFKTTNSIITN